MGEGDEGGEGKATSSGFFCLILASVGRGSLVSFGLTFLQIKQK